MILEAARLRNYMQHKELDFKFEGNLIGIFGANGHGKSNFVGGVRYALTGKVPGKNKDELMRWNASAGHVELDLVENDVRMRVHRGLGDGQTWMERTDRDKRIRGITAVNDELKIDTGLADIMFVEQKALDDVLFSDASKRALEFQRMCGLADTRQLHQKLGPWIQTALADNPGLELKLTLAKQQLAALTTTAMELRNESERLRALAPPATRNELEALRERNRHKMQVLGDFRRLMERVAPTRAALDASIAEEARLTADPMTSSDLARAQQLRAGYASQLATLVQRRQAEEALANAERWLSTVPSVTITEEQLAELTRGVEEAAKALAQKRGMLTVFTGFQGSLQQLAGSAGACCPLCRGPADHATLTGSLNATIAELQREIQELTTNHTRLGAQRRDAAVLRQQQLETLNTATRAVETARTKLDAVPAAASATSTEEQLRSLVQTADTIIGRLSQHHAQLSQIKVQRAQQERDLKASEAQLTGYHAELAVCGLLPDAERLVQQDQDLRAEQTRLDSEIAKIYQHQQQVDTNLQLIQCNLGDTERCRKTVADLELERSKYSDLVDVRQILTDVRDWFHYGAGPAAVSREIVARMNDDVQTFLQYLSAPFTAAAHNEELLFQCSFTDGRDEPPGGFAPATALSGAERGILAVAFRLASYVTFAQKQGVLLLDEPTAYWDPSNSQNFRELLGRLKPLARNMGLQILLITHDKACAPYMDSCLML